MNSIWDAPSDRDVPQFPYPPELDEEEPQPELAIDQSAAESFTDEECGF